MTGELFKVLMSEVGDVSRKRHILISYEGYMIYCSNEFIKIYRITTLQNQSNSPPKSSK